MAFRLNEAWINADQSIVAVKTEDGGYLYFANTGTLSMNNQMMKDNPTIAREISGINLEIMEARKNEVS